MRVYEANLTKLRQYLPVISKVFENLAVTYSKIYGKELQHETELGILKDNIEYILVAKVLNSLGIGVIPYQFKYKKKGFLVIRKGFTNIITSNIIYIDINTPVKNVQRIALHELFYIILYINPKLFYSLLNQLKNENDYIKFRNSTLNLTALSDVNCPFNEYEIESLANFFTLNPNNERITFAFFYKLNFPNSKVELPTTPFNQRKYLNILLDIIKMLKGN